jgi:hypothetical protein
VFFSGGFLFFAGGFFPFHPSFSGDKKAAAKQAAAFA